MTWIVLKAPLNSNQPTVIAIGQYFYILLKKYF